MATTSNSSTAQNTDSNQWVVSQIQLELDQALVKLERYIEHRDEPTLILECGEALQNSANVCSITGMSAQATLAQELSDLIAKQQTEPSKNSDQFLSILSEGVLTLRASLQTAGGDAIFIKLTPRVNNIRALTELPLASESDLFAIDLTGGFQSFSKTLGEPLESALLRKVRTLYQRAMMLVMRDGLSSSSQADLQKVFKLVYQRGGTAYLSAVAFTALAVLEKVADGDLELELALRQQFKRFDEVLKNLIAGTDCEDIGLLKNLLFYLAIGDGVQNAGKRILGFFDLTNFSATAQELKAGGTIHFDEALIGPVVEVLAADIDQAKTALEDALTGQLDFGETKRLLKLLATRMGDTLSMVGIHDAQATAAEISDSVAAWQGHESIEDISDSELSMVADALVRLEVRLKSLTSSHSMDTDQNIDSVSEVGDARKMLLDQGRLSIERSKADITDYIERNFDAAALEKVPTYLSELEGALRFYPLERLANIAVSVRNYVQFELLEQRITPEAQPINLVADVIVCIDYHLECLEQDASFNLSFLIDKAEENCAAIGYPASSTKGAAEAGAIGIIVDEHPPEASEVTAETPAEPVPNGEAPPQPEEEPPLVESSESPESVEGSPESDAVTTDSVTPEGEELDDISSIFIEELEEVVPAAFEQLDQWIGDNDKSTLQDLRRSFHTLKGGARMIGATAIGELSWALENLLNQISNGLLKVDDPIHTVARDALNSYAALVDNLRAGLAEDEPDFVAEIRQRAESLAKPQETESKSDEKSGLSIMADALAENRENRFKPLYRVMSEELDGLLRADQILLAWCNGAEVAEEIQAIIKDLGLLTEVARDCEVTEIASIGSALALTLQGISSQSSIESTSYQVLSRAYELLLSMLDSIASSQMIAEVPEDLLDTLEQLENSSSPSVNIETETDQVEPAPGNLAEELDALAEQPSALEPELKEIDKQVPSRIVVDDEFQAELMETFLEEAEDLLTDINTTLTKWRAQPTDFSHADSLHRSLHTLKGGARLSGLQALGSASHDFESYTLDHQLMRKVDSDFFDKAMEQYDALVDMVEKIRGGEPIETLSASTTPLAEASESVSVTAISDAIDSPKLTSEYAAETEDLDTGEVPPPPKAAELPRRGGSLESAFKARESVEKPEPADSARDAEGRVEMVRLRANELDDIINLSGESTVFRTRVEAEVNGSVSTIGELENTIDRIQMLARRLDVETQAQIVFRKEQIAESETQKDFDPLEMDRYSMLQQLSRQLNESASDLKDLRKTLADNNSTTLTLLTQTSRLQSELNDRLLNTRMVPFSRLMPRLQRMTRQISTELNKKVQLNTGAIEGELDRNLLDQILPALEHVLRNAIDHGIESEEKRVAANKSASGRIGIEVQRDGAQVVIKIADDGAGINLEKVKQRAIEKGLIDESQSASMQDSEIADLIFLPGFSTAESLTQISGRGVGMDVVRSIVSQLGGTVEVGSKTGVGSTFYLRIPFTLSVNRALMVSVGESNYALPLSSLDALARVPTTELESYYQETDKFVSYGVHRYRVKYLGEILKTATRPPTESLTDRSVPLALFRSGEYSIAAQVDEIFGSQEIVVKSLSAPFNSIPGISGAASLGDGSVVIALDMFTLMSADRTQDAAEFIRSENAEFSSEGQSHILVVDDSVTVRKVTSRFLKREGFAVSLARDGVEALQMINEQIPDLILLDVEMPHMDGFELIGILRANERFENIPIILITSRTGEKHRQKGLELGAQRYFGKPYREEEILTAIGELLPISRSGPTEDE